MIAGGKFDRELEDEESKEMEALSRHMKELLKEFCMDSSFAPVAPVAPISTLPKAPGSPASSADKFPSLSAPRDSVPDQARFRNKDVAVLQSVSQPTPVKNDSVKQQLLQPVCHDKERQFLCHRHACLRWRQSSAVLQSQPFRSSSRVSLPHGHSENVVARHTHSQQSLTSTTSSQRSFQTTSSTTLKIEIVNVKEENGQASFPTSDSFKELEPSVREAAIDNAFLEMRIKSPEPLVHEEEEDFCFMLRPPPAPVLASLSSSDSSSSSPFATPPLSDSDEPLSDIPRVDDDIDEEEDEEESQPLESRSRGVTLRQEQFRRRTTRASPELAFPQMRRPHKIESLMETAVSPLSSSTPSSIDAASASHSDDSRDTSSSRGSSVSDESQSSTSCAFLPLSISKSPVVKRETGCARPEREKANSNHGASPEYSRHFHRIDERQMVKESHARILCVGLIPGSGRPLREVTNILDATPERSRHSATNVTSPHVLSVRQHHPGLMQHRFESAQPILYPTPCHQQQPMPFPLFGPQMVSYSIPPPTYNHHFRAPPSMFSQQPPVPLQQQRHHSNAVVMMANTPPSIESKYSLSSALSNGPCYGDSYKRDRCAFCKSNGERETVYMSHALRDPETQCIVCPQLRKFICPICGATGDHAHTQSYCPKNPTTINRIHQNRTVKHLKALRPSAGKMRAAMTKIL